MVSTQDLDSFAFLVPDTAANNAFDADAAADFYARAQRLRVPLGVETKMFPGDGQTMVHRVNGSLVREI